MINDGKCDFECLHQECSYDGEDCVLLENYSSTLKLALLFKAFI